LCKGGNSRHCDIFTFLRSLLDWIETGLAIEVREHLHSQKIAAFLISFGIVEFPDIEERVRDFVARVIRNSGYTAYKQLLAKV
jgi:hypothetical protein